MGVSPLQLFARLTVLLALSRAAAIIPAKDHILLQPEHLCPCVPKDDCPRVWGTRPEDSLLGDFRACTDSGFVRCCGVKEHDSREHSIESPEHLITEPRNEGGNGSKQQRDRVIPPDIVVPVPFLFPEYLEYRTSTTTEPPMTVPGAGNSEEVEENDESGEWVYVDELSGEAEPVLAQDQVGSSPVAKSGLDEAGEGGVGTTTSGETSSGNVERDEETSSSSNGDKKIKGIVGEGESAPGIVQLPDTKEAGIDANREEDPNELPIPTKLETIKLSITPPKSSEASVSQEDKETLGTLDFSSEIAEPVTVQPTRSQLLDRRSQNVGKVVTREETSTQNKTEKVTEESSNFEKKTSSFTNLYDDKDGDYDQSYEVETKPIVKGSELEDTTKSEDESSNGGRTEVSTQAKSDSAVKESSKVEKQSSLNVRNTISENEEKSFERSDGTDSGNPTRKIVKPISFRGPAAGGRGSRGKSSRRQRVETISEQNTKTVEKESSDFKQSKTSEVEQIIANIGSQSGDDVNSESLDTSESYVPNVGLLNGNTRSTYGSKGQPSRGQRLKTTIEQRSESSEEKSSTIGESETSSDVHSTRTTVGDKSDEISGTGSTNAFFQKIEKTDKESSSSAKSSRSNIQTSKTEELSSDSGNSKIVSKEEKQQTSYYAEKNESTKEESSTMQREISSTFKEPAAENSVTRVETTLLKFPETKKEIEVPTQKDFTVSTELLSTKTPILSSILVNMLTGKLPSNSGAIFKPNNNDDFNKLPSHVNENTSEMKKAQDIGVWQVANRAYIPVLINAGFLKDRPISTGLVGLDPISGVTHSDITNSELAPELLPLSCGNVIFGERFRNGKTLVCEIPQSNEAPVRFLKEDVSSVSQGKLRGPPLPDAILPVGILASSEGVETSKSATALATGENGSRKPIRKRIVIKRPVPIVAKEDIREKKPSVPKRPQKQIDRGLIRHYSNTERQVEANVDEEKNRVVEASAEIGSKQTAKEAVAVSASSLRKSASSQESVSKLDNPMESTEAEFGVAAEELLKADRKAQTLSSKFYLLPLAPVLPPRPKSLRSSRAENLAKTVPEFSSAQEPAKVVEVVSETPPRRARVSKKRQRIITGKKLLSSDLKLASVKTSAENQFVISEDSGSTTGVYNRNSRQVEQFAPNKPYPERSVISADEISPSGRVNIVGPIPQGFYDRYAQGDQPLIELPNRKSNPDYLHLPNSKQKQGWDESDTRKDDTFKPSPIDPINWQ